MSNTKKCLGLKVIAVIAIAFGLLTLKSGGAVLFIDGAGRVAAGNYVPFVLWSNFLLGGCPRTAHKPIRIRTPNNIF